MSSFDRSPSLSADSVQVRKTCGLADLAPDSTGPKTRKKSLFSCSLCLESVSVDQTLGLTCGHRFCNDCWSKWIFAEFDKVSYIGFVFKFLPFASVSKSFHSSPISFVSLLSDCCFS